MRKISFKSYCKKMKKLGQFDGTPKGDFIDDFCGDKTAQEYAEWGALESHLSFKRASVDAMKVGKQVFKEWLKTENYKKAKKEKPAPIDGLSPNDLKRIQSAVRQVWSW